MIHDRSVIEKITNHLETELIPRATQYTTPVLWPDENGLPEIVGSSVAVRIGDDLFLLTAGHVLDMQQERTLGVVVGNSVKELRGETTRFRPIPELAHYGDYVDVAALRLSDAFSSLPQLTLQDLEWNSQVLRPHDSFLVLGYPSSKNRRALQGETLSAQPYSFLTVEVKSEEYVSLARNPSEQVALAFNRKRVWRATGMSTAPDLYGISGGGVWRVAPNEVENQSTRLAAIAVEWHAKARPKHVLATRIHPIVVLLADRYQSVRNALESLARRTA